MWGVERARGDEEWKGKERIGMEVENERGNRN